MPCIKSILSCGICILCFTTLTAQVSLQRNNNINNVVDENYYSGKKWSVTQVLKDSVSYQFFSVLWDASPTPRISDVSKINISITEQPPAPILLNVSEKLRSHIETSRFYESDCFLLNSFSCWSWSSCYWSLNPLGKFKRSIVEKFFFNHQ